MKNINCKTKIKLIETIKKSGLTIGKIALISGVKERTIMNWIYNSGCVRKRYYGNIGE